MSRQMSWLGFALLGMALLILGCGDGAGSSTLSGNVTYDGKPLERGYIELSPADGKGPTLGGPVIGGSYKVVKLHAGKYKVNISCETDSNSGGPPPASYGDAMAEKAKRKKSNTLPEMPPEAGQNLSVTTQPGANTQDFPLRKPGK